MSRRLCATPVGDRNTGRGAEYLKVGVHGADHWHVVNPGSEHQEGADGVHRAVHHVRLFPSHDVEDQHLTIRSPRAHIRGCIHTKVTSDHGTDNRNHIYESVYFFSQIHVIVFMDCTNPYVADVQDSNDLHKISFRNSDLRK